MKILVVSDSHGYEGNLREVLNKVSPIDMMIHLGDFESGKERIEKMVNCELHMVPGNNDFSPRMEKDKVIILDNKYRLFLTHGHRYGVYYGVYGLYDKAIEHNCDIVLYGHTHISKIDYMNQVTLINPGSISKPRGKDSSPTFLIIEIDKNNEIHFSFGKC